MPYRDKTKQRAAQAASYRRRYHAPGSTLREYHRGYTVARRNRIALAEAAEVRRNILLRREPNRYGYAGTLKPRGF